MFNASSQHRLAILTNYEVIDAFAFQPTFYECTSSSGPRAAAASRVRAAAEFFTVAVNELGSKGRLENWRYMKEGADRRR